MAREQATSDFFGRTNYDNLYLLASTEFLECPLKPTSKDAECTH